MVWNEVHRTLAHLPRESLACLVSMHGDHFIGLGIKVHLYQRYHSSSLELRASRHPEKDLSAEYNQASLLEMPMWQSQEGANIDSIQNQTISHCLLPNESALPLSLLITSSSFQSKKISI